MADDDHIEEWRPVVGWEGIYSVSSLGRVRRDAPGKGTRAGRMLACVAGLNGYPAVSLGTPPNRRRRTVHRLVAEAFLGPCPPGLQVNHRNAVKTDCAVRNLEYVTPKENSRHAVAMGLGHGSGLVGSKSPMAKLDEAAVADIRERLRSGATGRRIASEYRISPTTVSSINLRRSWRHV